MKKLLFALICAALLVPAGCSKSNDKAKTGDAVKTEAVATDNADVSAEILTLSEKIKGNPEEILPKITQEEYATMLDHMISEAKYYYTLSDDEMVKFTTSPRGQIWINFQLCTGMAHRVYLDDVNEKKFTEYNEYVERAMTGD